MSNMQDSPRGPNSPSSSHLSIPHHPSDDRPLASSNGNSITNSIVFIPIMYLVFVLKLMVQTFVNMFGNPRTLISDFVVLNREQNGVLKELPGEQERQQHDLYLLREGQVHQKDKVADLKRRIDLLEEKQRKREQAAAAAAKL